jgi:hypothetical protein
MQKLASPGHPSAAPTNLALNTLLASLNPHKLESRVPGGGNSWAQLPRSRDDSRAYEEYPFALRRCNSTMLP